MIAAADRRTGSGRDGAAVSLAGRLAILALLAAALLLPARGDAHELRPAIAAASIETDGRLTIALALNAEAFIAGESASHATGADGRDSPDAARLRAMTADALAGALEPLQTRLLDAIDLRADGAPVALTLEAVEIPPVGDTALARISTLTLSAGLPSGARALTWSTSPALGDSVIRVSRAGDGRPFFAALVKAGEASEAIALDGIVETGTWSRFADYVVIGFEHILPLGLDHIVFVIGLFLLSPRFRPLLWQVTSFTLAHTVALALGTYGIVDLPARIVEPLIAASIVFIAVENLFTDRLQRWRPAVVFAFGLLHGLGFAGVLAEVGLPRDQFAIALLGFNIGVEIGQLTVIALCFLAVGFWFRNRDWYRRAVSIPGSVAIGLIGLFWVVERIA